MTIYECQEQAKRAGYAGSTFDLVGPSGSLPCVWLDAHFGLFQMVGKKGFLRVREFGEQYPDLACDNLRPPVKPAST